MIVLRDQFQDVLHELSKSSKFSQDTETFGLYPFKGHRLFSIIIFDGKTPYYFNFLPYPEVLPECVLPYEWCKDFNSLTERRDVLWYRHNAKFDEHMLENEGVITLGEIHCTEAAARLEYNDHMEYSLAACLERIGLKKDDAVEKYIDANKLWKWETVPGKKTRVKHKFYNKVPLSLMQPYGEQDGIGTFHLGEYQVETLGKIAATAPPGKPTILTVHANEKRLTKTCAKIERRGIRINREYCEEAIEHEKKRYEKAAEDFEALTGIAFVDSGKCLASAFTAMGEKFPTTEKGNPSFTDDVLEELDSPVAKIVQEYRDAQKRCNTYFRSFLFHADKDGYIHANMRQSGTKTGRFSYTEPNLQNLTKEDDGPFPIRRAFIPSEGRLFIAADFKQMEFRLMLDYAGQLDLIEKIMAGFDPHTATAELVQALGTPCTRRDAKIINFGIAYGMGNAKLGKALGISAEQAREFKRKYFAALPEVQKVIYGATRTAETRGFVVGAFGRRFHFPDPKFAYRAFNAIDQGTCADIVKIAMNKVDDFLTAQRCRSQMILQVHDELVFDAVPDEMEELGECLRIMERVYPYRRIPMACSASHSFESLGDLIEGLPTGPAENSIPSANKKDSDLLALAGNN